MGSSPSSVIEMPEYNLLKKIQQLAQVQPSQEWLNDLRQKLLIEKRTQDLLREDFDLRAGATWGLFSFLKNFARPNYILRPLVSFLVILGLFGFGLGGLALASQNSLPGEGLYIIKTAAEQIHLALVKDVENRAKIQAKFTEKRIDELNQIIFETISPNERKEKTELAVNQLNQHLISLKDQLPSLESKIEPGKALAIAETVIEKSGRTREVLNKTKEKAKQEGLLTEPGIAKKLVELSQTVDRAGTQALQLMVDSKSQGGLDEDLAKKVAEDIVEAEQKITAMEASLANQAVIDKLSSNALVIKEQSAKAREILSEAKKALENNDLVTAVETIKVAKEFFSGAQETVEVLSIIVEGEEASAKTENTDYDSGSVPASEEPVQEEKQQLKVQFLQLSTF